MIRLVSPSILNVDKHLILSSIKEVEKCGAKWIHFDIMDGDFVPAKSFSIEEAKTYMDNTSVIKDVHIMVSNPFEMAKIYCDNGANVLTFHYEACKDENEINKLAKLIRSYNAKVGMSIKPDTPIENIEKFLSILDLVLVMSVEPGAGGQSFDERTYDKIKNLRKLAEKNNPNLLIEVDGGIKLNNAKKCYESGANVLVAGTYIFKGDSIKERFNSLNE